jgi:hypothetical protein
MEITIDNYLWHNGRRIDILDFEINQDWDAYLWTGQVQLAYFADFTLLRTDDPITLYIQGAPYQLIVSERTRQNTGEIPKFFIQISSPTISLEKSKITRTWNAIAARDICEELADGPIEWNILNWTIPSGRLSVADKTPIEVIKTVVNAAGGIIQTRPDGILKAQYKTPVAFNQINTATPTAVYTEREHITSYSESAPTTEFYNAVVISDEETDRQYYANYIEQEYTGKLQIYSDPWFEDFQITHTGHESITIGIGTIKYLEHTETIDFAQSQATVNYPIFSLQSVQWLYHDLGTPHWNGKTLTTTSDQQYSIATVQYTSRCIEFPITHALNKPTQTQFIIIEE